MQVINCRGLQMAPLFLVGKYITAEAPPSETYILLTSVHNDADDADDYNRVIGIVQLKAFSCASKYIHVLHHVTHQ